MLRSSLELTTRALIAWEHDIVTFQQLIFFFHHQEAGDEPKNITSSAIIDVLALVVLSSVTEPYEILPDTWTRCPLRK